MGNDIIKLEEYQRALIQVETVEEAGLLRVKIETIAKQIAPRLKQDRFKWCQGNVEACVKHGEMWNACENKAAVGNPLFLKNLELDIVSISDAMFKNATDATMCAAIATLSVDELQEYFDQCTDKDIMPTLGGAYRFWKETYGDLVESDSWLRIYQIWNFGGLDKRFGLDYPGRIPGQINQNLNYYYTEPGDLVVDLFAGGGTTVDVCKFADNDFGNRQCEAFDIEPIRSDVQKWDVVNQGIPPAADGATLVFLDPPYWRQKKGEYSGHETNLANMPLDLFHKTLVEIISACRSAAKYTALIIGPTQENWKFYDHAAEMINRVGIPFHRIQVPYSTQQHGGDYVTKAKEAKKWLYLARDLLIWKVKPGQIV